MLSCTLPCSNHAVAEDLELIHHVPKLKVREYSGKLSEQVLQLTAMGSVVNVEA